MVKNYFKVAIRNLLRSKGYTIINIAGLALGMACVFLIIIYVLEETIYDTFHKDAENIYRIDWYSENPQTRTPHPMAQAMVSDFPEVSNAVSISPLWGHGLTKQSLSIRNLEKDIRYDEQDILSVDSTFFDVFSFPMLSGNGKKALKEPGNILLSESMVQKYFGDEDPIGKRLAINSDTSFLVVAGVFKDVPQQSHFHFDFLISYTLLKLISDPESEYYTWKDFGHYNYIRVNDNVDVEALEKKLLPWALDYLSITKEQTQEVLAGNSHFRLTPITDIHLKSQILWELESNGNIEYIYILIAAAVLILVIACTNFINLTTARSAERAKEIGIRKSLGGLQQQIAGQFLSESIVICLIAFLIAGLLVELSLPVFNNLAGKSIGEGFLSEPVNLLLTVVLSIVVGLLAGIYPAIYLSSLKPGKVLKGKHTSSSRGIFFRKALVVFQFTISMVLITTTLIIYNQLDYLQNRPLGFEKEGVIEVNMNSSQLSHDFQTIKNELLKINGVKSVSAVSNTPGRQFNQNPAYSTADKNYTLDVFQCYVEYDVFNVLNIELIEGRLFETQTANRNNFVINETAAKQLRLENPVGSEIVLEEGNDKLTATVIGVVKDFNFQTLHQPVRPLVFVAEPSYSHALIKVNTADLKTIIPQIEEKWLALNDGFGFQYSFLDENIKAQYLSEMRMGNIFTLFAVIAIVIASMGLYGLAILSFSQRKKEVGVRKVLGATASSLLFLLNKDFSRLILVAVVIASPIAYFIITYWLNNFTYKAEVNVLFFLVGAFLVFIIAIATLSILTYKTIRINPTETLQNE